MTEDKSNPRPSAKSVIHKARLNPSPSGFWTVEDFRGFVKRCDEMGIDGSCLVQRDNEPFAFGTDRWVFSAEKHFEIAEEETVQAPVNDKDLAGLMKTPAGTRNKIYGGQFAPEPPMAVVPGSFSKPPAPYSVTFRPLKDGTVLVSRSDGKPFEPYTIVDVYVGDKNRGTSWSSNVGTADFTVSTTQFEMPDGEVWREGEVMQDGNGSVWIARVTNGATSVNLEWDPAAANPSMGTRSRNYPPKPWVKLK